VNPQQPRDFSDWSTISIQAPGMLDLFEIQRWLWTKSYPTRFRSDPSRTGPLANQGSFKISDTSENRQNHPASSRSRVGPWFAHGA
jgi:hypothetical protein